MLKIILAKLCFAFCFTFYIYVLYQNQHAYRGYQKRLSHNLIQVGIIQDETQETLRNIICNMIFFMMISSSIMIFTRSVVPKLIGLFGFLGFFFSNQNPQHRSNVDFQTFQQTVCIVAGMLILIEIDKNKNTKNLLTKRQFQELVQIKGL